VLIATHFFVKAVGNICRVCTQLWEILGRKAHSRVITKKQSVVSNARQLHAILFINVNLVDVRLCYAR
jgi:hypothetical protein